MSTVSPESRFIRNPQPLPSQRVKTLRELDPTVENSTSLTRESQAAYGQAFDEFLSEMSEVTRQAKARRDELADRLRPEKSADELRRVGEELALSLGRLVRPFRDRIADKRGRLLQSVPAVPPRLSGDGAERIEAELLAALRSIADADARREAFLAACRRGDTHLIAAVWHLPRFASDVLLGREALEAGLLAWRAFRIGDTIRTDLRVLEEVEVSVERNVTRLLGSVVPIPPRDFTDVPPEPTPAEKERETARRLVADVTTKLAGPKLFADLRRETGV